LVASSSVFPAITEVSRSVIACGAAAPVMVASGAVRLTRDTEGLDEVTVTVAHGQAIAQVTGAQP
jgi:hypothetical protein